MLNFQFLMEAAGAVGEAGEAAGNPLLMMIIQIVPFLGIFAVMYFIMIRPQRKKDRAVKDMLAALKKGDRVCTIGGIYATVAGLKDDTVTLTVGAEKNNIVVARWAIRSVEDVSIQNESEPEL